MLVSIHASNGILFDLTKKEAQRRELPPPVYGAPAQAKYPGPPPDIPPAIGASSGYSVPILQYGPPKINFASPNKLSSLFDSFKGSSSSYKKGPSQKYGPPPPPRQQYGPPPKKQFSSGSFPPIPQKLISNKPFGRPQSQYGPPAPQKNNYGCEGWTPIFGPAIQAISAAPIHTAPAIGIELHAPQPAALYGAPIEPAAPIHTPDIQVQPLETFNVPSGPAETYGPPAETYGPPASAPAAPIQIPQEIHAPESSYGPPPTGAVNVEVLPLPQAQVHQQIEHHNHQSHHDHHQHHHHHENLGVQQIPEIAEHGLFQNELGGGGFDIIKSQGFEVSI